MKKKEKQDTLHILYNTFNTFLLKHQRLLSHFFSRYKAISFHISKSLLLTFLNHFFNISNQFLFYGSKPFLLSKQYLFTFQSNFFLWFRALKLLKSHFLLHLWADGEFSKLNCQMSPLGQVPCSSEVRFCPANFMTIKMHSSLTNTLFS